MTHQSGLLLIRAQDASVAIAFASRFALVCIANFAFGFGAGYLYSQYRNLCASDEEDDHAASAENDKPSVTQVSANNEQHSTTVPNSVVEEQYESLETASGKFMDSQPSAAEPKSPPSTPLRADGEPISLRQNLVYPNAEQSASETPNQELHGDLEELNTALAKEDEKLSLASETTGFETAMGEEQENKSIVGLQIQPIHGCLSQSVTSLKISQHGVENHLLYAVSEFTGRFISNEKVPALSQVAPVILDNGHLSVSAPGQSTIVHEPRLWGQMKKITIHGVHYDAVDQGDNASQFFANYLEIPGVRLLLVRPPPLLDEGHGVSQAWPSVDRPLLIASGESMTFAEDKCNAPVGTNLVISGSESDLSRSKIINIDDNVFEVVKITGESSDGNAPMQHLHGGGNALIPANLGKNECSLVKGQMISIVEFRSEQLVRESSD